MIDTTKMTGNEFLDWLHKIKKIDRVEWDVTGDLFNADEVRVIITADGEQASILFGSPKNGEPTEYHPKAFLCLIANKVMNQPSFDISFDSTLVVNSTRKALDPEGR